MQRREFGTSFEMPMQNLGPMPRMWHKKKQRPRTVVGIAYGPLVGCGYLLEASGWWLGWFFSYFLGASGGSLWAQWKCAGEERHK